MKIKLLSSLIVTFIMISTVVYAEEPWLAVCSENQLSLFMDKRYFVAASVFADSKTIQIDRKNKIIRVWTIKLLSKKDIKVAMDNLEQQRATTRVQDALAVSARRTLHETAVKHGVTFSEMHGDEILQRNGYTITPQQQEQNSIVDGKIEAIKKYGYLQDLIFIDYRNLKIKYETKNILDCYHNELESDTKNNAWSHIRPNSLDDAITQEIMKKYNLK